MHMTAIVLRVRSAGKIEKLRVIYAYFFQIIKELMEIDVRSELSNYRGGYSTPNVQIMLIQGRPSPLNQ